MPGGKERESEKKKEGKERHEARGQGRRGRMEATNSL